MIDAGHNPKLPVQPYAQSCRLVSRRRNKPEASRESSRALSHCARLPFSVSDVAIAEQHYEVARECLSQPSLIYWTVVESVRELCRPGGKSVATSARCDGTAKTRLWHKEH